METHKALVLAGAVVFVDCGGGGGGAPSAPSTPAPTAAARAAVTLTLNPTSPVAQPNADRNYPWKVDCTCRLSPKDEAAELMRVAAHWLPPT